MGGRDLGSEIPLLDTFGSDAQDTQDIGFDICAREKAQSDQAKLNWEVQ